MLFSNDDVARFIDDNFEPAWMSVRGVPIVRIDFGEGRVITRTLHGNIATYVCNDEGKVLDVLPGIYDVQPFLEALEQLQLMHQWMAQGSADEARWKSYHAAQLARLNEGEEPYVFVGPIEGALARRTEERAADRDAENPPRADRSKVIRIEGPLEVVLMPPEVRDESGNEPLGAETPSSEADVSLAESLAADTRYNETVRRQAIHEYLAAQAGPPTPADMMHWLYREVLDADLEDPYLGLGETLFANYPFEDDVP